jgi:hypothetical protein
VNGRLHGQRSRILFRYLTSGRTVSRARTRCRGSSGIGMKRCLS